MKLSKLDWDYVQEHAAHFAGRGWVFARLDQFLHQPPGVLLLLGEPGTGKTAIASQLALAAAGRLTPAAADAPHRAVPITAAYFCRAGNVDLLDIAQRLSDQLAEAVPGFARACHAALLPEIQVGDVQVHTGDIAAGGSVTGVHIDLSRLDAETAFMRAVTLPLKRVREAGEMTRIVLLVDALDESLASTTTEALPRLLGDIEYAHLLVTARPDHRAAGGLRERAERMDLLADAPPGSDDVLEYLQRRLTSEGVPGAMARLSKRIAEQASGNFLYAFYVVETLRRDNVLAALDAAGALRVPLPEGGLPGVYSDFLRRELWRNDRAWSTRFGPVFAPLAVAQDKGLTTEQLRPIADRLSQEPMTRTAIRDVTRTARQFLEGPAPDGPFRMYHQSFANFLVDPEQNPDFLIDDADTHNAIVEAYAATDPLSWDDYARRNLALHAAEAGQLDRLLEDARFLLVAEPSRLVPHLDSAQSAPSRAAATVYRLDAHYLVALDRLARASQLELTAHQIGYLSLATRIAGAAPDRPWQTLWSHGHQVIGHRVLVGHVGAVTSVAVGALPDGTPVVISGGVDATVRVWRLADGTPVGEPLTGHGSQVNAVEAGALPDGTPVIISIGDDGMRVSRLADGTTIWKVRVRRLADYTAVGQPLTWHKGPVNAVAVGALPDGTPVVISGGLDATVRVWRLADGTPVGEPLTGHYGPVSAVAAGALPDGTPVIISGGGDTVRVWRLADGAVAAGRLRGGRLLGAKMVSVGEPRGHWGVKAVVAAALPDGTPVIISSSADTVRVWRLADGTPVGEPLSRKVSYWGNSVAVGALPDGTPVIISSSADTVRVWRLADGTPVGEPLTGHRHDRVTAVGAGVLPDGTPVIISGSSDAAVRVWRLDDTAPAGESLTGRDEHVSAMAVGALPDGTPVIITGGHDRTVRVWRLADGTPIGESLTGRDEHVSAMAVGALPDGTPVIITGGHDRTVRVWLADGTPVGEPLIGHNEPVSAVAAGALPDGTAVIISSDNSAVRVWQLADGTPVGEPLIGHNGADYKFAIAALPDGTPVIIISEEDHSRTFSRRDIVRVRRLADGTSVGDPLRVHYPLAVGALPDGTAVIISTSSDFTVRVRALPDGTPIGKPLAGHHEQVSAVAVGALLDGAPVIITSGYDRTVRVWRLADGALIATLGFIERVLAVAALGNLIVTAAEGGIALHHLAFLRPPAPAAGLGLFPVTEQLTKRPDNGLLSGTSA